jgi:Protein of unknown function (DUF3102)
MPKSASVVEQVAIGEVGQTDDDFLDEVAGRIRQRMTRTAQDIVEIGCELIAVKERVGHGNFLPWIEREFAMSYDMAARFMNVARNMAMQISQGAKFQQAVLYELASPSIAEEVRTEITERAKAGEKVTLADVRSARAKARTPPEPEAKAAARADRRRVTEGFMAVLDFFERDDVDPAARAAFVIKHFDLEIAGSKLTIRRLSRAIDAVHAVVRSIATDLDTAHRSAPEGRPEPAPKAVVR